MLSVLIVSKYCLIPDSVAPFSTQFSRRQWHPHSFLDCKIHNFSWTNVDAGSGKYRNFVDYFPSGWLDVWLKLSRVAKYWFAHSNAESFRMRWRSALIPSILERLSPAFTWSEEHQPEVLDPASIRIADPDCTDRSNRRTCPGFSGCPNQQNVN